MVHARRINPWWVFLMSALAALAAASVTLVYTGIGSLYIETERLRELVVLFVILTHGTTALVKQAIVALMLTNKEKMRLDWAIIANMQALVFTYLLWVSVLSLPESYDEHLRKWLMAWVVVFAWVLLSVIWVGIELWRERIGPGIDAWRRREEREREAEGNLREREAAAEVREAAAEVRDAAAEVREASAQVREVASDHREKRAAKRDEEGMWGQT